MYTNVFFFLLSYNNIIVKYNVHQIVWIRPTPILMYICELVSEYITVSKLTFLPTYNLCYEYIEFVVTWHIPPVQEPQSIHTRNTRQNKAQHQEGPTTPVRS